LLGLKVLITNVGRIANYEVIAARFSLFVELKEVILLVAHGYLATLNAPRLAQGNFINFNCINMSVVTKASAFAKRLDKDPVSAAWLQNGLGIANV